MIDDYIITEKNFSRLTKEKLGNKYERALLVFNNCGPNLSWDVTNMILHAVSLGKVDQVLSALEKHFQEHLKFQHPDIRGTTISKSKVNPTGIEFKRICTDILELQI